MPAALLAATALLVTGGTAAPARADSGDLPGAVVEQAVDAAQGIAAEALAGDEAAIGLAAPTDGTEGIPTPAPSGQGGAAPANGQAGAAPCDEEVPPGAPIAGGLVQQGRASPATEPELTP